MNNGLQVDTGAMAASGKDTIVNSEYFSNELANLRNNVEGLMTIWKGQSANEFNDSYQVHAQNLEAFRQLLNSLGESITKGATILDKAEEENTSAGSHMF